MNGGIGTYGEHTLHAMLKRHITPNADCYEIPVGRYVADVLEDGKIYEIQTRQFGKMRAKLGAFLESYDVTVVYPIAAIRWTNRVDAQTGEVISRRRSPKRGSVQDAFAELYSIREHLTHPRFHLQLVLMEIEDFRHDTAPGRRRAPRFERIPLRILEERTLSCPADYAALMPQIAQVPFTSADYAVAAKIPRDLAGVALLLLTELGVVERVGKRGNAILYERKPIQNGSDA